MCTHACVCVLKGGVVLFKKKKEKKENQECVRVNYMYTNA